MRAFAIDKIPKPDLNFQMPNLHQALDLEIGAGQGLHAIRYCQTHPERALVAVEKTHTRFQRLSMRQRNHPGLTNLHAVHADAVAFVCHFLPDACLNRVFLLYPNPYPKAKQANLRWHNRPFLAHLLRKMQPGAEITIATNDSDYCRETMRQMVEIWHLELRERRQISPTSEPRTHFEKKYLARGETCWNLIFCKSASGAVE